MKLTPIRAFILIIFLAVLAAIPATGGFLWKGKGEIRLLNRSFPYDFTLRRGLDLQGGLQLVLEADMSDVSSADRPQALDSARAVVERRVDFLGVAEPTVQTSRLGESYRIIVELPGVTNPEEALALLGATAQLDFREGEKLVPTGLTGRDLARSTLEFDSTTGNPQIGLTFTTEGAQKFEEITARNVGKPLAIFLDEEILSAPTVQGRISGGNAVITGEFTLAEARRFVTQLNAGALPTPISVLERRQIGPTLGVQELQKSVVAGLIGLALVVLFMIGNYGRLGILATAALAIYGTLTMAVYKLVPVTLTLSGIAGFILSVGMAVDANVLVFERIKEERRWGKELKTAMELGFGRAWDSIRDANFATLATVSILFNPFNWSFLVTSGMVRGFALTLGLGVLLSLFTGVLVTRTLVRVFYR
ncbi:protein-export membrane protein SecD [candidate division WWE3 bacterium RBG_19FT_COMBO_53_11]|uniref:Protein translocase subunit SecD n=1 Tax=candidate division WWE3 bacterium RBG_19FT_COMBO_53_11 TaxID=1802613 RepID=A0A1F4UJ24_UNCKA|nr:MAG: protein-export membrane protein SecD [candidate division WWE3 bacterium RBG_16_52_45]OGC44820.1 MAG: protein-export membrane protein SecD [candidate division WWE3 bacterium RBG_19FT_COMBO_53_11]